MLFLKKGAWLSGIPFAFSVLAVIRHSVALFVVYILIHFVVLRIMPAFRHRENIGMFIMVAFSSIPVNLYIFQMIYYTDMLFDSHLVLNIIRGVFYYIMLLSIEEIIMGVLTRGIWKKQYKSIV